MILITEGAPTAYGGRTVRLDFSPGARSLCAAPALVRGGLSSGEQRIVPKCQQRLATASNPSAPFKTIRED